MIMSVMIMSVMIMRGSVMIMRERDDHNRVDHDPDNEHNARRK